MKNTHRGFVTDSRSYGGISTYTDHKLVKATIKFTWWRKKYIQPVTTKIDIEKLEDKSKREEYQLEASRDGMNEFAVKVTTLPPPCRAPATALRACRRRQLPPSLSRADQTKKNERSSVVADLCQRMS